MARSGFAYELRKSGQALRSKAISDVSAGLQHKATGDLITVVAQMLATVIRTNFGMTIG